MHIYNVNIIKKHPYVLEGPHQVILTHILSSTNRLVHLPCLPKAQHLKVLILTTIDSNLLVPICLQKKRKESIVATGFANQKYQLQFNVIQKKGGDGFLVVL